MNPFLTISVGHITQGFYIVWNTLTKLQHERHLIFHIITFIFLFAYNYIIFVKLRVFDPKLSQILDILFSQSYAGAYLVMLFNMIYDGIHKSTLSSSAGKIKDSGLIMRQSCYST